MALEKMQPVKKERLCEQIYEDCLVKSAKFLELYEAYSNTLEGNLPDSCYTNFRDALFHFRKLAYSSEERELYCQEFAIKEHLSRALTDAASSVIDVITWVAENMLRDDRVSDKWKPQIRLMLHNLKNIFLRKRLVGMMISGDEIKVAHEEIIESLDTFLSFSDDNCKEIFAHYSFQYNSRAILEIEKNAYKKTAQLLLAEQKITAEEVGHFFPALDNAEIAKMQKQIYEIFSIE